jgi:hypothetical protein
MTWLIVAIIVIVLIAIAFAVMSRRRKQQRTATLRERFGPEYDRTLEREGKQGRAEKDLARRADERDELQIRELEPADRDRFAHRWDEAQHLFVDDPREAISQADTLVVEVMRARGYPTHDFEARADHVSVDHPELVENFRGAHGIAERSGREGVSTEDQRRAMVHFRGLFDELLGTHRASGHGAADRAAHAATEGTHRPGGEQGAVGYDSGQTGQTAPPQETGQVHETERVSERHEEPRGSSELPR